MKRAPKPKSGEQTSTFIICEMYDLQQPSIS